MICSFIRLVFCIVTCEEYDLLLRLNQVTIAKYNDMTTIASGLADVSQRLNDKCKK